jgi:ketosteroid isomerase-like protein
MSAEQNTAIVKDAYAAFARRDIPALLNLVSDDVDWQAVVGASAAVPTSGRRVGRQAVAKFFEDLAGGLQFRQFEPREFIAERDKVVVLGFYEATSLATGRGMSSDWVMVFTVRGGKIAQFREFADVAALNAAFA